MKKSWPELIFTVRMGLRTCRPCVNVYAADLLLDKTICDMSEMRDTLDTWNNIAWLRNGEQWFRDVTDVLQQFRVAWDEKHKQHYFAALKNTLSGVLPEEILWLIADHAKVSEWQSGIDIQTASDICIIQQPSEPYPRFVMRRNFFNERCCRLAAMYMTFLVACYRHETVFGQKHKEWLNKWIRYVRYEIRWVHLDGSTDQCPICGKDYPTPKQFWQVARGEVEET